jgi:large subunit ribosomal protein L2
MTILTKNSGRDSSGRISIRHQGGRQKRYYRDIDWKRDKENISGVVHAIEYDPNRSSQIAFIVYKDGDKRYISAPEGIKIGQKIIASEHADIRPGNSMTLKNMPIGTVIHNIEIQPGAGAKMVRGAGSGATILSRDAGFAQVKLPSGETRLFRETCRATIGQMGNIEWKNRIIGKAGRNRHKGIRPSVRGVAMNPNSHPHGGGEGRSGIGMPSPKSPWGKPTLGKKTRKRIKYSDKFIIQRRKI